MNRVAAAVERYARETPQKVALEGAAVSLTYAQCDSHIVRLAGALTELGPAALGLFMDNTPAWVIADLAAATARIPVAPMPMFFSAAQIGHLMASAGPDLLLTDQPAALRRLLAANGIAFADDDDAKIAGVHIHIFRLTQPAPCTIAPGISKVTYTSGTTGEPKGVCLTQKAMEDVAVSLQTACHAGREDRHLCALPLATLLENIGGVYVPLLAGGTCILPGLEAVGMRGAAGLDPACFLQSLVEYEASTCIMIPQMLLALVSAIQAGGPRPAALRYAAVGGAPVSQSLLEAAATLDLPAYEGYGLSEAASVVAVNAPGAHRPGTAGKPLPHVRLGFADDGEILVSGALFSGYLGQGEAELQDGFCPTGDTGYLDDDGFLHITGRKKHIFITAFGRNVSPEWVERELMVQPAIAQAVVFGEAKPFNVAVLVACGGADLSVLQQAVVAANARLPDYARIGKWLSASEPFSLANGQWTGNGRPRRKVIEDAYADIIRALYDEAA